MRSGIDAKKTGIERLNTVARHISNPECSGMRSTVCDARAVEVALVERGRRALEELESQLAGFRVQKRDRGALKPGVDITKQLDVLEDRTKSLDYNIADHLPGPLRDSSRERSEIYQELLDADAKGANFLHWEAVQKRYCKDGMRSNFVLPAFGLKKPEAKHSSNPVLDTLGGGGEPFLTQQIILAHPEDCERIARTHIKKSVLFSGAFDGGIIFTRDNEMWEQYRHNLSEAFHPKASLEHIFPRVAQRAEHCVRRLRDLRAQGDGQVNMSEFFLHETLAQLMLGLFGFPEEFMEATNKRFRDSMSGKLLDQPAFMPFFLQALGSMIDDAAYTSPSEVMSGGRLFGPLSRIIEQTTPAENIFDKMGNIFIFAFAGHDTTGHTLTWLTFELSKRRDLQARLQAEIDELHDQLQGRALEYNDLFSLKFMTRCVMETLRLWPAVPNGTFRELEFDDWVHGENGDRIHVPKGTNVQITNWMRHRDPSLWGPDANVFNPDRDFQDKEIWNNRGIAAFNPSTARFSPFTYGPRDCIGKNFAQSEMRAILFYVFRNFSFELANPSTAERVRGVNFSTMGPLDVSDPKVSESNPVVRGPRGRALWPVGLQMRVMPRS